MKQRIYYLDFLKIIAMFMVVLSHCLMEYKPDDFYASIGFNAIWLLQMPLFMFVSGYLQNDKGKNGTFKELAIYIGKKFLVYIIPFITFFIFAIWQAGSFSSFSSYINCLFDHAKQTIFNVDKSLWFCFVLFILTLHFSISKFISNKLKNICKFKYINTITFSGLYILFLLITALVGYKVGFNFLGAKYIIYYSAFYYFGYIYKSLFENIILKKLNDKTKSIVEWSIFGVSAVAFAVIICCFKNIYKFDDFKIDELLVRTLGSVFGLLFSYLFAKLIVGRINCKFSLGKLSLEFYYIHILVLRIIEFKVSTSPELTVFISFVVVSLVTLALSILVNLIPFVHYALFGTKPNLKLLNKKNIEK